MTWNVRDAALPAASVAETVTVVVPSGKTEPLARESVGVTVPETASRAVTVNVATAPVAPVASSVRLAGTVMTGGVVSRTVTWNVRDAALPAASVAEAVTVVVPSGKTEPLARESVGMMEPSTASTAVTV